MPEATLVDQTLPDRQRPDGPLRIALLTHSVNPRGGVVHTLELARALHGLGHAVTVLAPALPGQAFFRAAPHAVAYVPVGPPPADFGDMVGDRIAAVTRHLAALLREQTFDVLHAHDGIGGNALANAVDAGLIAGFVRTVHHLDHFDDARVDAWQRRSVIRAAQLLCVSDGWCRILREQYERSADQVDNGVDLARFTRSADASDDALADRLGLRAGVPRWLLVGGVEERKNSLRVLQAFGRLRAAHPGAQLIVAGGASLLDHSAAARAFRAELDSAGLQPGAGGDEMQPGSGCDVMQPGSGCDVVVTGPLPDALMPALFRQASALVMPSLREGFGLVVLEALACGTPVVVSDRPPFTEYLDDSVRAGHALYVDPLDVDAIAAAMQAAIAPERRRALAAGLPVVCRRFSWAASAERHAALYRRHVAALPAASCAA